MKLIGLRMLAVVALFALSNGRTLASAIGDNLLKEKLHIVFLISEDPDNYEAPRTISAFAEYLRQNHRFKVTVLLGEGPRTAFRFPGLEAISQADLLVVFARRIALTHEQLGMIKNYLKQGKPLVGIRTANHAFSLREPVASGHEAWAEFVPEILGCENRGYSQEDLGTEVSVVPDVKDHPVLKGIELSGWHGKGSTYLVAPLLDQKANVLLTAKVKDKNVPEPVTWTRVTADNSRVFYTSLGYPTDFELPQYRTLLTNGIYWALNLKTPGKKKH